MAGYAERLLTAGQGPRIGPGPAPPAFVGEDPARMATVPTQAIASLPTDPTARVRYFASQRFPNMPIEAAMDRYFWKDDRLGYRGEDGKAYYEEAKLRAPTSMANMSQNAKVVASGAGPALPVAGGIIGGLSSLKEGPAAVFTGAPQAALGGGIGDMVRQALAGFFTGEEKSLTERAMQTGGAALQEGAGQMGGNAGVRVLSKFGRTPTYNIPETTAVRDAARKWDIPLTPGEETANRTLLRQQKVLANTTEGEIPFTEFYQGRNDKVGAAVNRLLNGLSSEPSPRMASAAGVEGAKETIQAENRALAAKAGPKYKEAESGVVSLDQLYGGQAGERIKIAIDAVKGNKAYADTIKQMPNDTIPVIDAAKKWLDDEAKGARANNRGNEARLWEEAADELRTIADANVPAYGQARQIFEENVPTRTALQEGVVGDVAKLENADTLRAGGIIFGKGSSPEDIRFARQAFEKAGKLDKWDALGRSYLEQVFNEVPDSSVGSITNIGGTFRKAIFGNKRKRDMMQAAFEHRPEFWADMNDLMLALEATGRAMKGESITAFAQAGQRELAREGGGLGPAIMETIELWRTPGRIARYWADVNTSKYSARQAELLTTPEGRGVLRQLRTLGPGSAGSVIALSHFLLAGGLGKAGSTLAPEPDGPAAIGAIETDRYQ